MGSIIVLLSLFFCQISLGNRMETVYEWKHVEYEYPSEEERQKDIDNGVFNRSNVGIIDVDVYKSDKTKQKKFFVAIPRYQAGIPVSLGTVSDKRYDGNPLIKPYPSWEWHKNIQQCKSERIVSVFRVYIDKCKRLWVLDNGRNESGLVCPPQILAFDLETDKLIHKYEIPKDQYEDRSTFVTPMVDVRDSCDDAFVYAADCQSYALIIHDVKNKASWKIVDKTFYPSPDFGTYKILGDQFDLMDGILGLSLSPYKPNNDRKLFYQAMSSDTQHFVPTSLIRDKGRFKDNPESSPEIFYTYPHRRNTQSAAEAIDKNGIMYFGLMSDVTLNCWDIATDYNHFGIVDNNVTALQFISGAKVFDCTGKQELYVLSSRFQKLSAGTFNPDEVNFRILKTTIDKTLVDKCTKKSQLVH